MAPHKSVAVLDIVKLNELQDCCLQDYVVETNANF